MDTTELVLSLAIPGSTLLLVAAGVCELRRQRRRGRSGTPVTATYVNEFTAIFYGAKRMELDHRDSMSMMREEDAQGGPPGYGVDLERGVVVLPTPEISSGDVETRRFAPS
ncbi:DUF6191 domain-containing protein [Actinokineospora iranica]|uniref:Uncharacterized protein n=1 Tax=Actinokineospora iranica TaxID=1271860 RepID=A0A1G6XP24_9PSEU|nr:DUF6191 domain-containing protein [Actinokineospora iranica]SDD79185.1 hypothetical protein SAMN05216174_11823 [Actinokineospora iranica]